MELEAKEHRFVILALKKLLEETIKEMNLVSEDDEEHIHVSNDAMLINTMITGFEEENQNKYQR
jgi:hypothetical protein